MTTLLGTLDMDIVEITPERVEVTMPISPKVLQPWGYLHGGATLALLETAASYGAAERTDAAVERPFGINMNVTHKKSGVAGQVRGIATLEREEPSSNGGRKQFWHVEALDDADDVLSEGTFLSLIVPLERLKEKDIPIPDLEQ